MELVSGVFGSLMSLMGHWWYWAVALCGYALLWTFEYKMNGGDNDLLRGWVEDFLFAIPGGRRRRGAYIKKSIDSSMRNMPEGGGGYMGDYSYQEIRDGNRYDEVGAQVLPGPLYFWGRVAFFLFWALAVPLLALILLFLWVLHGILLLIFGGEDEVQSLYDGVFNRPDSEK
jgi:hypothetical protein